MSYLKFHTTVCKPLLNMFFYIAQGKFISSEGWLTLNNSFLKLGFIFVLKLASNDGFKFQLCIIICLITLIFTIPHAQDFLHITTVCCSVAASASPQMLSAKAFFRWIESAANILCSTTAQAFQWFGASIDLCALKRKKHDRFEILQVH